MISFFYRWFWEEKQKWLILFSLISLCLWLVAHSLVYYWVPTFCARQNDACFNLWLETLGAPFYGGSFLKILMIAPLLILPFSKMVFRVWAVVSLFAVPFAFYHIIVLTPIHGTYFSKFGDSNLWGSTYMIGTLAIIVVVAPSEWLYKKYKVKK